MLGLLDLARWAIRQSKDAFVSLKEPVAGRTPKLEDHLFEPNDLAAIKEKFATGNRLAVYVPLTITRQFSKNLLHTGFSVFLERDEKLLKAEDHFIRQGITIPEVTSLKHKGVRAIVSITEQGLSAFLGDAENPAHTDWERQSNKFRKRYKLGPSTLNFVKTSPREIVKILTRSKKGREENLLQQIFSLPENPATREEKKVGDDKLIETQFRNYLQLNPSYGGFILTREENSKKVPKYITIWIAYEVRRGNPLKKYSPQDFDLSKVPLKIQLAGARLLRNKHNVLQIEVQKYNFKLAVTGFDMQRDLRIKTYP